MRLLGRLSPWVRVPTDCRLWGIKEWVVSPSSTEELTLLLPLARFRDPFLIVTEAGMALCPEAEGVRGDLRSGVSAGSLDFTRSSSFCIFPISPRIW